MTKGAKPAQHDIFIAPKLITQAKPGRGRAQGRGRHLPGAAAPARRPAQAVAFSIPGLQFPFFVFMETQVRG